MECRLFREKAPQYCLQWRCTLETHYNAVLGVHWPVRVIVRSALYWNEAGSHSIAREGAPGACVRVSSSSSSGVMPSGEHSRLHNWTILCVKPRRVEATVCRLQVRLDGTEPGSTWSASPAAPVGWKTVDGCLKGTGMILWWISLCDMSEQT